MVKISDEKLMAYVDAELNEKEQAEIEKLLECDPEVRAMVDRFRKSTELLKAGCNQILDLPVPQRLIDTVNNHQSTTTNIVQLDTKRKNSGFFTWPGFALAATLALSVGLFTGAVLVGGLGFHSLKPNYYSLLQNSLEIKLSGSSVTSEDGLEKVTPLMTFTGVDGLVCREFERINREHKTVGLACRDDRGRWLPKVEVDRTLLAANIVEEFDYQPASGPADPINMALTKLGTKKSLTAQEEELLRDKGWQ